MKKIRIKSYREQINDLNDQIQKLINVTWKQSNLWLLTRDRVKTDTYENYTFKEDSSFGVFEGNILIKEQR